MCKYTTLHPFERSITPNLLHADDVGQCVVLVHVDSRKLCIIYAYA